MIKITPIRKGLQKQIQSWKSGFTVWQRKTAKSFEVAYASVRLRVEWACYRGLSWIAPYRLSVALGCLTALIVVSAIGLPSLNIILEPHFREAEALDNFRSLVLTIGGALIGAAAIVFSLVLFAIQVNVERMPHGMFRKVSTDGRLLSAFGLTLLLAILTASLSMIPNESWVSIAVLGVLFSTLLTLLLFLYAYRRALSLVNPVQQLRFVVDAASSDLRKWSGRARRAAPLIKESDDLESGLSPSVRSTHDIKRIVYFRLNPWWTNEAKQAVLYATSYAGQYAEQGDYEVSGTALTAIVNINRAYIEAKGKTFFTSDFLFNNPLSTDAFINETLECLKRNLNLALSRKDELQTTQTLQAMALLTSEYLEIDYSNEHASKMHAHLAASYLSNSAEAVVPHQMADVLMEWMRFMGTSCRHFADRADPNDTAILTDKMSVIAGGCVAKESLRPVTHEGILEFARLTFALFHCEKHDPRFALKKTMENVSMVAKVTLMVPESPLFGVHAPFLGPFYSVTQMNALPRWMTDLTNALSDSSKGDTRTENIIRNIEHWAEHLHQIQKDLLLLSIEKQSHFIFDVVHWNAHIADVLLALSNGSACTDHSRDKLRHHACRLLYVFSWVPDKEAAVRQAESAKLTETLFEVALNAYRRGCEDVSDEAEKILFSWAFKAGKYLTGWDILHRSMCALSTLAIVRDGGIHSEQLKQRIQERLNDKSPPSKERLDDDARELRRTAATLNGFGYPWSHSSIEKSMQHTDREKLALLLNEVADILSPDTAGEPLNLGPI